MEKQVYKLRWINGYQDDLGVKPYRWFIEKNGKEAYEIKDESMNRFLKENKLTTNDFRKGTVALKNDLMAFLMREMTLSDLIGFDLVDLLVKGGRI